MARTNVSFSSFNPGALQPAGQPSRQPYGVSSGDMSQSFITQTPMLGADGRTYIMQQVDNPDGTSSPPQYVTKGPSGETIKMTQAPDGRWTEGVWHDKSFGETVFGDKKLMAFLAIAGGAGAYAAASGAAGGAGGAMLGGGTGATPGVVAGGTMGTAGLGGAGAASAASQLGGTSTMTPQELEAMDAGGGGQAGTGQLPAETWQDIATRYGGNVLEWAAANPQLAAGLLGGVAGFLGNKDDFTSSQTVTTDIDPRVAEYRNMVLDRLKTFGDPSSVPAHGSGATNTAPTSFQQSMMPGGAGGSGGGMQVGIQGGTAADFAPGGRFAQGGSGSGQPTLFREAQQYTGPTSYSAATNPLASENNPYITAMLDSARQDMQKYYANQIAPKFASGSSFGSSGLGFAEVLARDDEAKRFGDVATNLRYQDHSLRAQLQEQQAGRMDAASQFGINTGRGVVNDNEAMRQYDLTHARGLWGDQEGQRQFNLGHERGLWQDQQAAQIARMQAALQGMNAPGSTTSTTTQTAQGNPWLGALGGFLAGSNIWKT